MLRINRSEVILCQAGVKEESYPPTLWDGSSPVDAGFNGLVDGWFAGLGQGSVPLVRCVAVRLNPFEGRGLRSWGARVASVAPSAPATSSATDVWGKPTFA